MLTPRGFAVGFLFYLVVINNVGRCDEPRIDTYGDPMPPGDDEVSWPEKGVGLLFQCCQADVANQFEFIQQNWANNPRFVRLGAGQDALVGQAPGAPISVPRSWGESPRMDVDFARFVRLLGGEYFFTPSIPFLMRIGRQ